MRKVLFLSILFWAVPVASGGETDSEATLIFEGIDAFYGLEGVSDVRIDVNDSVSDGCMQYPDKVKAAWEVELRRLGFGIRKEDTAFVPWVVVQAFGGKTNGICVVDVRTEYITYRGARFPVLDDQGTILAHAQQISENILSGPATDMNSRIADLSRSHVNELYLTITRAKQMMEEKYPRFLESYRKANERDAARASDD